MTDVLIGVGAYVAAFVVGYTLLRPLGWRLFIWSHRQRGDWDAVEWARQKRNRGKAA